MVQDNSQSKTYEIHSEYHSYILVVSQLHDIQFVDWKESHRLLRLLVILALRLDVLDLDNDVVSLKFVMGVSLYFSYS